MNVLPFLPGNFISPRGKDLDKTLGNSYYFLVPILNIFTIEHFSGKLFNYWYYITKKCGRSLFLVFHFSEIDCTFILTKESSVIGWRSWKSSFYVTLYSQTRENKILVSLLFNCTDKNYSIRIFFFYLWEGWEKHSDVILINLWNKSQGRRRSELVLIRD